MNEWGNNPATYEAIGSMLGGVGVIAVFVSTLLAWQGLRETKAQRQAAERELAVRMRPWVGLFGFAFEPARSNAPHKGDALRLNLRNFGILPAQRSQLQLVVRPVTQRDREPDNAVRRQETGSKVLLPGEKGDYRIDLLQYPQFSLWREGRRDVRVEGTFTYTVDQLNFETRFEATIWFSEGVKENDHEVRTNWRNTETA